MDPATFKIVAQIAGVAGIALAVFLTLFRDVIRKQIFPMLTKQQAFRLLTLVLVLTWTVALAGIGAWVVISLPKPNPDPPIPTPQLDTRLVGEWLVTSAGALPENVARELKTNQTKEGGNANKKPESDVEQSIRDLAKAFGGLADAASQSGSFVLQLKDDSTYKVSDETGIFAQSTSDSNHLGRSGNWVFSQDDRRLVLLPTGGGVAPAFNLTTIENNRLVDQSFGGRGCVFARRK